MYKEQRRQRRHSQVHGSGAPVPADWIRMNTPAVARAASTIFSRVAIENFFPEPGTRDTDAVVGTADGKEIAND
jgi:hypothetical protein